MPRTTSHQQNRSNPPYETPKDYYYLVITAPMLDHLLKKDFQTLVFHIYILAYVPALCAGITFKFTNVIVHNTFSTCVLHMYMPYAEHSGTLRPFTLFNLCSIIFYHDPVIKYVSDSFPTAAVCSCCIVLPHAVHLAAPNILCDL